ncbi:MAG TPA: DUF885 domain-containing protein [Candidatus Thermoplasmatota archaeon]|jgi:uncharacterized protein (DUF885 family)|nr:DUF885 domain-containing protein [Candidatus Thermoplasmatota archaeon]
MQAQAQLDALVREMFEASTRRSPAWATDLGIHTWDQEVSDPSRARVKEDIGLHQGWLARADALALHAQALSPAQRVDAEALRHSLRLWLHDELELRSWERNPDLAMEFLDHVFGLMVKEELDLEERCAAIGARLDKAPAFLRAGRDRFGACPVLWVDMAIESAGAAPAMLEAAEQLASQQGVSSGTRERVRSAVKHAREALKEHTDWLQEKKRDALRDGWAAGAPAFNKLVELRALGADADAILARGEQLVAQLREDTRRAAEQVLRAAHQDASGDVVARAQALIEAEHPRDWPAVLDLYRRCIEASRDFVAQQGIAELPPGERLEVIETPAYLRHIMPFAAYVSPGKFERRQVGLYMVTPREPKNFPLAEVLNTTVHEGYPGHHLQLTGANQNPSTARLFVHAVESIEGWAHYCEEMMLARGFAMPGARPEQVKFIVLKDQLWRACRIVIDVKLHRGAMTFDEGVGLLREVARMGEREALAEVKRYTQSPAYQLSYLWGKLQIQKLREDLAAQGVGEQAFHDRYIRAGSLPLGLMRQELGTEPGAGSRSSRGLL